MAKKPAEKENGRGATQGKDATLLSCGRICDPKTGKCNYPKPPAPPSAPK